MEDYNPQEIESKWQAYWVKNHIFKADNDSTLPKYYVLDMFPYPSGAGLHVGHPMGYIASDIFARYKRLCGFNVLHPQGYDSFGLPAEQYAIATGQHPAKTTETNINTYRKQLDRIGFSFDWSREVRTSDAHYYRYTQWIFIQLFESWYDTTENKARHINALITLFEKEGNENIKAVCDDGTPSFDAGFWNGLPTAEKEKILLKYRLAYLSQTNVNWCENLGTVLANDEIIDGLSERGGHLVTQKKMTQWSMRITAYAQRLLDDLEGLDWTTALKDAQRNWIGRSKGATVTFSIKNFEDTLEVFTTRLDTIFGVSFMVLAPEHPLVEKITTATQKKQVTDYVAKTAQKSERDRLADVKTVSGAFTGSYALHPFTNEPLPIWISDYVLASYGTGAVMSVPAGDARDHRFATYFDLPIKNIFKGVDITEKAYEAKDTTLIDSDFVNGLTPQKASEAIVRKLTENKSGTAKTTYRLRDAVFSRQRYWGEPFPVYYKNGLPQIISSEHLPIKLPQVKNYLPTKEGNPPLGNATHWAWCTQTSQIVANEKIDGINVFPMDLNTMPGWAGSSWYFNRYMDSRNEKQFASKDALNYWREVDLYVGGSEHATGHLLYARFWQKFLYDRGYVPVKEFARKLINQGMILGNSALLHRDIKTGKYLSKNLITDFTGVQKIHVHIDFVNANDELDVAAFQKAHPNEQMQFILEDGKYIVSREVEKMSKSKYNVVNPDAVCAQYGADALRMFEMFLGPIDQSKPWNTAGISGVYHFLKKFWRLYETIDEKTPTDQGLKILHKTIKKIKEDTENFSFNTAVSTFMIAVNELSKIKAHQREILQPLVILIAPYAPHIAEELWEKLGYKTSISFAKFPVFDEKYLQENTKKYPISFNGKMRFTLELSLDLSKDAIEKIVMKNEKTSKFLNGNQPKKVIVVPHKIVNIVF